MENEFTVESVLKEVKKSLNKYESIIKECETNPTKKKISEGESWKKKLDQKIKMVKTIIKNEEDSFMLESYEDMKNELNKRLTLILKKQEKNKEKNNFNELFSSSQKQDIGNLENINYLDDEQQSLKNTIKMSTEINSGLEDTNNELDNQSKSLNESSEKVVKTLQKVPIIGKMLGEIKYYKIKEKLIIGCVVGVACVFGLYIIFYRKK